MSLVNNLLLVSLNLIEYPIFLAIYQTKLSFENDNTSM